MTGIFRKLGICSLGSSQGSSSKDSYQEKPGDEQPPPPYKEQKGSDEYSRDEKSYNDDDDVVLTIHPVKNKSGVLVEIQPPVKPRGPPIGHVPCEIVLVIDVSGSMEGPALAPMNDEKGKAVNEDYGLTILDLTKHAARTILSTLNEDDKLAIVAFSNYAEVIQGLVPMTDDSKRKAEAEIENMRADGGTNLWAGIKKGIEQLKTEKSGSRVQTLMVLTDGQPTQDPPLGYVSSIRKHDGLLPTINTFGFGYNIQSAVLKSIAEAGYGNYAFIPDAGMIGTVFVHAVSHLQTTYATQCLLRVSAPEGMLLQTTAGKSIDGKEPSKTLELKLGNLQYGQCRDIYFKYANEKVLKGAISAELVYRKSIPAAADGPAAAFAQQDTHAVSPLRESIIAYHQSRSQVCQLLSSFLVANHSTTAQYSLKNDFSLREYRAELEELIARIPASKHNDQQNESIMQDLKGQVRTAISKREYWARWGVDYFISLWNAHEKQLRNSFKDPGPMMYNENDFFLKCCNALDEAFDKLPPPRPSRVRTTDKPIKSMSVFNYASAPCFAASSYVLLADGYQVPIAALREGTAVQTPVGPRLVRAVMKTRVHEITMCRIDGALATPWHPVRLDDYSSSSPQPQPENNNSTTATTMTKKNNDWAHPASIAQEKDTLQYSGYIYSVLLERDSDPEAHAIRIGGVWGVTLGHGILNNDGDGDDDDVRAHKFLGDYDAVSNELATLGPAEHGVYCGDGVRRDSITGRVCGFKQLRAARLYRACEVEKVDAGYRSGLFCETCA